MTLLPFIKYNVIEVIKMDDYEVLKLRNNKVVKSNTLIQQSRHQFSVQQQKILLFLISQLKPGQEDFEEQSFDIVDFCRVCGVDIDGGKTYKELKDAVLGLANKGFWLRLEGKEVTVRWIDRAEIPDNGGIIKIQMDTVMKPFLLELKARFTAYDLKYTLAMRSKYSVRLYELLKSYANQNETLRFELDRLKTLVGAEYERWQDFKRYVLEVAVKEINAVSDLRVSYTPVKKGRSFVAVLFDISVKKDIKSQIETERNIYQRLTGRRHPKPESPIEGQIGFDGSVIE